MTGIRYLQAGFQNLANDLESLPNKTDGGNEGHESNTVQLS